MKRTFQIIFAAILLAACNGDRLQVVADIPAEYKDAVATVTIDILEPGDEQIDCDTIAFADASTEAIVAITRQQLVWAGDEEAVAAAEVARVGRKLLYLRAYDASGHLLLAGCEETDTKVGEGPVVRVEAVPLVDVSAPGPAEIWVGGISGPMPAGLTAVVVGLDGEPVVARDLRVRVAGPANSATSELSASIAESMLATDSLGQVEVLLADPAAPVDLIPELPGPWVLDLHARWQRLGPVPLTGMQPYARPFEKELDGEILAIELGKLSAAGDTLVGVAFRRPKDLGSCDMQVMLARIDASSLGEPLVFVSLDPVCTAFVSRGSTSDRFVAIGGDPTSFSYELRLLEDDGNDLSWTSVSLPRPAGCDVGSCDPVPTRMFDVSECDGTDPAIVVEYFDQRNSLELERQGYAAPPPPTIPLASLERSWSIDAVGCVEVNPGDVRRVAVTWGDFSDRVHIPRSDGTLSRHWLPGMRNSVILPPRDGHAGVFVGSRATAGSWEMLRFRLTGVGGSAEPAIDILSSDPLLLPAIAVAEAHLDRDGEIDIVSLHAVPNRASYSAVLRVTLAATYQGKRLSSFHSAGATFHPHLATGDVDNDGLDELLLAREEEGSTYLRILTPVPRLP